MKQRNAHGLHEPPVAERIDQRVLGQRWLDTHVEEGRSIRPKCSPTAARRVNRSTPGRPDHGGLGVSVHGSHRVATERMLFAMPETAIGLFPDVGASYVLPRLPHQIGAYLGLAGARIKAADMVALGLATHFVSSVEVNDLLGDLVAADWSGDAHDVAGR
jgi:hypothetical protein